MKSPSLVLSSLAALALGGCTVLIDGGDKGPAPVPFPTDPCLDDGRPTVHLWVAARIDRSTANLADAYGTWLESLGVALIKVGARPTRMVLLPLDEQRGIARPLAAVGCGIGGFELKPADVFRFYAARAEPRRAGPACAVTPLVEAGAALQTMVTDYPEGLDAPSGRRVFDGDAPDAVIVLHLDSLSRSAGFDEASCQDARRLADPTWLAYDRALPADRVFHWFVATDEGVSPEAFADKCRKVEGVSLDTLDVLEPSARALFGPLSAAVEGGGASTQAQGMCEMLAEETSRAFLLSGLLEVIDALGLDASRATGEAFTAFPTEPGIGTPLTPDR